MNTYRLTDEELQEILNASKPVPYLIIGAVAPESPTDKAMRIWDKVAKRVGCIQSTIDDAGTGDMHDFKAEPI